MNSQEILCTNTSDNSGKPGNQKTSLFHPLLLTICYFVVLLVGLKLSAPREENGSLEALQDLDHPYPEEGENSHPFASIPCCPDETGAQKVPEDIHLPLGHGVGERSMSEAMRSTSSPQPLESAALPSPLIVTTTPFMYGDEMAPVGASQAITSTAATTTTIRDDEHDLTDLMSGNYLSGGS